jgi:hypothetical protein
MPFWSTRGEIQAPSAAQRARWTSTYRLSSATRQQRILRAVQRLDDPGITTLGRTQESELTVIIECTSAVDEVRSRQLVMAVDPLAVRTETTRAGGNAHPRSAG